METIFCQVSGRPKRAGSETWHQLLVLTGKQAGKKIYAGGKVLKDLEIFARRSLVGLTGEWVTGPVATLPGFKVKKLTDAIVDITPKDLAYIAKHVAVELSVEQIHSCLEALKVSGISRVKLGTNTKKILSEKVGEQTGEAFIRLVNSLRYTSSYAALWQLFSDANTGLDSVHAAKVFHSLDRRARKAGITVMDIIKQNPWVIVQCLEDKKVAIAAANKIGDFYGIKKDNANLFRCMAQAIEVLTESSRRGHSFTWNNYLHTRLYQLGFDQKTIYAALDALDHRNKSPWHNIFGGIVSEKAFCEEIATATKSSTGKSPLAKYLPGVFFAERLASDLTIKHINTPVKPWKLVAPRDLNNAQKKVIESLSVNNITVVIGEAGTGKSRIIRSATKAIFNLTGKRPFILAPTAMAAFNAGFHTVSEDYAATISRFTRLLFDEMDLVVGSVESYDEGIEARALANEDITDEVVIVDEASMLTPMVFSMLLNSLKPDTRILICGDPGQLPPIGADGIFPGLIEIARQKHIDNIELIMLTENYRSGDEVLQAARRVRRRLPIEFNKHVKFIKASNDEEVAAKCLEITKDYPEKELLVMSPTRTKTGGTTALNFILRKPGTKIPGSTFSVGDKVLCKVNDYADSAGSMPKAVRELRLDRRDIFNGWRGEITKFEDGVVEVVYVNGITAQYRPEELVSYLELAYAITVHKAQGGQSRIIVLSLMNRMTDSDLIYTAITRCQHSAEAPGEVYIIAPESFLVAPYAREDWESRMEEFEANGMNTVEDLLTSKQVLSKYKYRVLDRFPDRSWMAKRKAR